jgi:hypothetical protein
MRRSGKNGKKEGSKGKKKSSKGEICVKKERNKQQERKKHFVFFIFVWGKREEAIGEDMAGFVHRFFVNSH